MSNKLGIKELAQHLGISIASVSRALHNPNRVSKEMRERVQAAADELGYKQNTLASSLRTAKTKNIVAIIPDLSDTFNAGVIRSMEDAAIQRGYSILFGDSQGDRERELRYGDLVQSKRADGVIFFSERPPFPSKLLDSESFALPPMVNSCEVADLDGLTIRNKEIPYITIDNFAAASELTQHLIDQGHSRIAVITGDPNTPSTEQRLAGYRQAINANDLELEEELIFEGTYTIESGQSLTKEILKLNHIPTAILCMCDESAIGSMHTLKEQGLSIPDDVAVAGFDDIRFAEFSTPTLTTIAQPVEDIGRKCANLLIDIIEKEDIKETKIILPHKLVIRESTAAISR